MGTPMPHRILHSLTCSTAETSPSRGHSFSSSLQLRSFNMSRRRTMMAIRPPRTPPQAHAASASSPTRNSFKSIRKRRENTLAGKAVMIPRAHITVNYYYCLHISWKGSFTYTASCKHAVCKAVIFLNNLDIILNNKK